MKGMQESFSVFISSEKASLIALAIRNRSGVRTGRPRRRRVLRRRTLEIFPQTNNGSCPLRWVCCIKRGQDGEPWRQFNGMQDERNHRPGGRFQTLCLSEKITESAEIIRKVRR